MNKASDTAAREEFRDGEGEPISISELNRLEIEDMPEDVFLRVLDNYFPETTIRRSGDQFVCEIEEHLYTKYWVSCCRKQ